MRNMGYIVLTALTLLSLGVEAQFRISSGTSFAVQDARVTVATSGNVRIDDSRTLNNTVFVMQGGSQSFQLGGPLQILGLGLTNGTNVTMNADLTVNGSIVFEDGYINPGANKLLYTGTEVLEGSSDSHVRGMMWSRGTGVRSYPIASSDNIYAPFVLLGVAEDAVDIGVEAIHSSPNVTNVPALIPDVSQNWHWEVSTSGGSFSGAAATLPILVGDENLFSGQNVSGVVLQADATRSVVESLGGSLGIDAVTSTSPGVGPYFFLGTVLDVKLSIHNIISPNADGINDYLVIENLGLLGVNNEVILLDRWGVKVYEKTGFENFDAISNPYDGSFDFLQPGNYICIVKVANRKTMTQTITVVRQ